MQTLTTTIHTHKPNYGIPSFFTQNPNLKTPNLKPNYSVRANHVQINCRGNGVEVSVTGNRRLIPFSFSGEKEFDVATLGNLCVDVVLSVPKLPPLGFDERKDYMEQLSNSPPDKVVLGFFRFC